MRQICQAAMTNEVKLALEFKAAPRQLESPRTGIGSNPFDPDGLAYGRLLVVQAKAGRLTAIDLTGGAQTTVAGGFDFATAAPPVMVSEIPWFSRR